MSIVVAAFAAILMMQDPSGQSGPPETVSAWQPVERVSRLEPGRQYAGLLLPAENSIGNGTDAAFIYLCAQRTVIGFQNAGVRGQYVLATFSFDGAEPSDMMGEGDGTGVYFEGQAQARLFDLVRRSERLEIVFAGMDSTAPNSRISRSSEMSFDLTGAQSAFAAMFARCEEIRGSAQAPRTSISKQPSPPLIIP